MSEIKMLPLPKPTLIGRLNYLPHEMQSYGAAMAEHNVAAKDSEIEALRVRADAMAGEAIKHEARAERLAEALLELCNVIDGHEVPVAVEGKAAHARDALRDHEQVGAK